MRRQKPAAPPADFIARLTATEPTAQPQRPPARRSSLDALRQSLGWWLTPATAALIGVALVVRSQFGAKPPERMAETVAGIPAVKADALNIQSELVNTFDTVALLPTGEPVRFRCREWIDEVTLRDRASGLVVERRSPRVEVVPVRFETY